MKLVGRDNNMKLGFEAMPAAIEKLVADLSTEKLAGVLDAGIVKSLKRVIITGCGDSYAATLATKDFAAKMFKGCDYHAVRTIDFSRHYHLPEGEDPARTLVAVISVSGGGARVAEAMARAQKMGCATLAITAHPESRMAQYAANILKLEVPQLQVEYTIASQTRSYITALLTTIMLAIYAGTVFGKLTEAEVEQQKAEIVRYAHAVCSSLDEADELAFKLADAWKDYRGYDFVGSGSDFATAYFGTAKFFEYYGAVSSLNDSEDWCHINYFMRDRDKIGTVAVASKNSASFSRTVETIASMQKSGRNVFVVTDASPDCFIEGVSVCCLPATEYEHITPLLNFIPLCMLGNYCAIKAGYEYFGGTGPENPLFSQDGGINTIKSSKIEIID